MHSLNLSTSIAESQFCGAQLLFLLLWLIFLISKATCLGKKMAVLAIHASPYPQI